MSRIHFVGEQTNVANWLSGGVDAFISGARTEAFGLVLGEAALAGLPIIAPSTGGIPEFITHNDTGILYENSGVAPIVHAIETLLDDQPLQKKLGTNAFNYVSTQLTIERNTQAIQSLYLAKIAQSSVPKISLLDGLKPLKSIINHVPSTGGHHG